MVRKKKVTPSRVSSQKSMKAKGTAKVISMPSTSKVITPKYKAPKTNAQKGAGTDATKGRKNKQLW